MNQSFAHTDHKDIDLQVTLKTGQIYQLGCSLLRTYSEQYDNCDAHALIYIHQLRVYGRGVAPASFDLFRDPDGRSWKVKDYRENSPPDAPGLIIRLTALQTNDSDSDDSGWGSDSYSSSYGDDIYEGVDWGDVSTFNQAAWDNVPDRD